MGMILALSSKVAATTFFVSPTGSDSNPGTEDNPFQNIQKCANLVIAGDTCVVKDGIYIDNDRDNFIVNINKAGKSNSWITIRSESKYGAKLDGQNNRTNFCWNFGPRSAYIRVEDFELFGCKEGGVWGNSEANNIYIKGNHIHDIYIGLTATDESTGKNGVFLGKLAHHWTFDSNIFHTIGRTPKTPPSLHDFTHDHGIYSFGDNIVIKSNVFYNQHAGWALQIAPGSSVITITDNIFKDPNQSQVRKWKNSGWGGFIDLWSNETESVDDVKIIGNVFDLPPNDYVIWSWPLDGSYLTNILISNNRTSASKWISLNITEAEITYENNVTNLDNIGYPILKAPKLVKIEEK